MNKFDALQILGLSGKVTQADIKKAYKRKAQANHPDKNPAGAEIMKLINVAYESVKNLEEEIEVFKNESMENYPAELVAAINAINHLGLNIEVCGLWVWVSGDTKPHKETLKANGFYWSKNKSMWYFRPQKAKSYKRFSKNKNEWAMDEIRNTFGASSPNFKQGTRALNNA
tara:strand:- start:158 stop:670 length:513 start_codon:yes stop_codon:yes gene_type:complete